MRAQFVKGKALIPHRGPVQLVSMLPSAETDAAILRSRVAQT